jgi:tetratricopeptide (TPR) repeat protein
MASTPIKLGLAVRQVSMDLMAAASDYREGLPSTHLAVLEGRGPQLKQVGGFLVAYTPSEFPALSPLKKQLEINRCHAEALLALARAGELAVTDDERALLTQRALGIIPTNEGARLIEAAACPEFSPHFLTSGPERMVSGLAVVEQELGTATALSYGFLLMAGVRSGVDLAKYGRRIEELFDTVTSANAVRTQLEATGKAGMQSLPHEARVKIVHSVHRQLWQRSPERSGESFLLTQVIDGYLGIRPGAVGDDLGLAVADSIVLTKLTFPVTWLLIRGGIYIEIGVSPHGYEFWNPVEWEGEVRLASARKLDIVDLLAMGYTRMARGYANAKSYAHGSRAAHWVLALQPKNAEAYEILGQCRLGEQKPREAIEMCEKAIEIDRRLADAYYVQGNAFSMMGRWTEAIERYRTAIQNRVGFAEAYNNLGLALQRNGEFDRAAGAYNEATRVRPDYAEAYYNLGNMLLEQAQLTVDQQAANAGYDKAIEAYTFAVKIVPGFAGAHYNLGQAHYAKKNLPLALASYQAAVKANPKHAGAWHNMGIVYRDLGQPELAVEALEKAVTLNPILLR